MGCLVCALLGGARLKRGDQSSTFSPKQPPPPPILQQTDLDAYRLHPLPLLNLTFVQRWHLGISVNFSLNPLLREPRSPTSTSRSRLQTPRMLPLHNLAPHHVAAHASATTRPKLHPEDTLAQRRPLPCQPSAATQGKARASARRASQPLKASFPYPKAVRRGQEVPSIQVSSLTCPGVHGRR